MSIEITTRRFTGKGGIGLAADVGGPEDAPAVLLLHGGGQTRHSWGSAMRSLLEQGYQVVNLDSRGHGDSDWSQSGEYEIESLAGDVTAVIDSIGQPPALVGASMGGAAALYAVGNGRPHLASAIVLVDIVPELRQQGADRIIAFMRANPNGFADLQQAADTVAAYYPERPRPQDPSGLMKNLRRHEDGRLYWHWDPRLLETRRTAEPPSLTVELNQAAENLSIPSLLVRGLKSDIVSDEGVAALRSRVPHLEVADIGGAGHMVAGDRNDSFNAAVIGFLNRHLPLETRE